MLDVQVIQLAVQGVVLLLTIGLSVYGVYLARENNKKHNTRLIELLESIDKRLMRMED